MKHRWIRVVPAALVGLLLALAVLAPSRRAGARSGSPSGAPASPTCASLIQQGGGGTAFGLGGNQAVTQPVNFGGNVAACSLTFEHRFSTGYLWLMLWDPLTLAPDPTTVALRSRAFNNSETLYGATRVDFVPPIVLRQLANVAESSRTTTAIEYRADYVPIQMSIYYDTAGAAETPVALRHAVGGVRVPLFGPHPVLSHAVCGGDSAVQDLYVVQSVMTTSWLSDPTSYELIQRFRVPVRVRLHWAELAYGSWGAGSNDAMAIMDLGDAAAPPESLPPPLTLPFLLEPKRDYWLLARLYQRYQVFTRQLTGEEGPNFTANIGTLYWRTLASGLWSPVRDRALCFRLIGEPLARGGAPSPQSPLRLRVAPNPAAGAAVVLWSGAAGPVRFDVLDARGRRVGSGTGEPSPDGRWTWGGARGDGRPLPAGLYFVRATDGAGRVSVARVVLVR